MATHRLEEAAPLADRVIVVESGSIVFDQTWQGTGRELVKLFEFRKEQIL